MPWLLKVQVNKILFGKLDRSMNRMKAYCEIQTSERIKHDADIKMRDFYTYLLKAKDPETGQGFTHAELASEAGLLMIAGNLTDSHIQIEMFAHQLSNRVGHIGCCYLLDTVLPLAQSFYVD